MSDIDAYIAVSDEAFDEVFAARFAILTSIAPPLAWANATTPGLTAIHALLEGPVKLDLFFERASAIGKLKRPCALVLLDKAGIASQLDLTFEAPRAQIGHTLGIIIRMTRQGALWPVRTLMRGQFSTFAMMELDLINKEIAQMMALQAGAKHLYTNPFSLSRALRDDQRALLDALTSDALRALAARDLPALKSIHLRVFDALVAEAKAACAALDIPYPIEDGADATLRALIADEWPVR
jgi:hypothetical protein